jgi:hypothetical protein
MDSEDKLVVFIFGAMFLGIASGAGFDAWRDVEVARATGKDPNAEEKAFEFGVRLGAGVDSGAGGSP